jgi:aryl-alcohol dehydrogenase-like predicted oxidoreductase
MKYRRLGKTGYNISEVSLGTWQLGSRWGEPFDWKEAEKTLNIAFEAGINFFDTADVYNGGLSEQAIGKFLKTNKGRVYVATKAGRKLNPHVASGYNAKNIRGYVEDSLKNMGVERIDLLQLHCPPTDVFYNPEMFRALDAMKAEGKIAHYGVSVERIEEALKALTFEGVATVQIIFNMFRLRPTEVFFPLAKKNDVGIIVRVPLASGLLTGKFSAASTFGSGDHRNFNREGAAFDKGETFSGVNYDTGLAAVEELKKAFPDLPSSALKYTLMFDAVSCVIPGASSAEQAQRNAAVSDVPPLSAEQMNKVKEVYDKYIKDPVHYLW